MNEIATTLHAPVFARRETRLVILDMFSPLTRLFSSDPDFCFTDVRGIDANVNR